MGWHRLASITFSFALLTMAFLAVPGVANARSPFMFYFAPGSAELTERGERLLAEVTEILLTHCHDARLAIVGHDDMALTPDESMELSKKRALNIARRLRDSDIAADRMTLGLRGQLQPAYATSTGVAEPLNRRVEVTIGYCAKFDQ